MLTWGYFMISATENAMATVRLLRTLVSLLPSDVAADALTEEFPWAAVLPEGDRAQLIEDLLHSFLASAESSRPSPLVQTLREWRNTANIHTDPALVRQLSEPIR